MNAAVFLLATACIPGADPQPGVVPYSLVVVTPASLGEPVSVDSYDSWEGVPPAGMVMPMPPIRIRDERPPRAMMGQIEPVTVPAAVPRSIVVGRAKLVVALPAGTRLFIDDQPVQVSAGETTFHTPLMREDTSLYYRLRGELAVGGETICESALVVLRPGQESWVSFPQLHIAAVAPWTHLTGCRPVACATLGMPLRDEEPMDEGEAHPVAFEAAEPEPMRQACAKLVVMLPAGGRLFIDGQPMRTVAGETIFHTPPLEVGATYGYRLRADLLHGGQVFQQELQVVVRAGEGVRVTFPRAPLPPSASREWHVGWR
ncbi:MAG TPA: TIGR03000 domain-containing protein [Gemmataceae bacterium]|nr:TIGR03000 domain-containing protein [Gemmataceae bacterium]